MHSFYRVDFMNDKSFSLRQYDEAFIHRLIDTKKINLRYEVQPYLTPQYIITASTADLKAFITKYADEPQAYGNGSESRYIKLH